MYRPGTSREELDQAKMHPAMPDGDTQRRPKGYLALMPELLLGTLAATLVSTATVAQLPLEGFGQFDDLCPYLFDRSAHGATEVDLRLHWGSTGDGKPSFHDKVLLKFPSDTVLVVLYEGEPLDTFMYAHGEWITRYERTHRERAEHAETDSAGIHIVRERYRLNDGRENHVTVHTCADSTGTTTVARSDWSDGNTYLDSSFHSRAGTITSKHYMLNGQGLLRTSSSSRQQAEVIKGHHFPTLMVMDNYCTVWTYELDRRGRLKRVDEFTYDTATGEPGGHDHLVVRYGQ